MNACLELTAETTVEEAKQRRGGLDVLQRFGINHCCGAHLPLREAAAAAGVAIDALLAALAQAASTPDAMPAALAAIPASRRVSLDVRDTIRRGEEPFATIMAIVAGLAPDQALVLRAPFEPVPLYRVLAKRGFACWAEHPADDDWVVSFYRGASSAASPPCAERDGGTLDVRGLEPPQPMVAVLERLDTLPPGATLTAVHDRRPLFLYPQLEARGFTHRTEEPEPGVVHITIRRGA